MNTPKEQLADKVLAIAAAQPCEDAIKDALRVFKAVHDAVAEYAAAIKEPEDEPAPLWREVVKEIMQQAKSYAGTERIRAILRHKFNVEYAAAVPASRHQELLNALRAPR